MPPSLFAGSTALPSARVMPKKVISGPIASPGFKPLVDSGARGVGKSVEPGGGTVGAAVGVTTSRGGGVGAEEAVEAELLPLFFTVWAHPDNMESAPRPATKAAAPTNFNLIPAPPMRLAINGRGCASQLAGRDLAPEE